MDFFVFMSQQWLLVSLLLILIYAFAITERIKSGKPIPAHEVTRLMNSDEAVLLDVRNPKEFSAGHISGAINIPLSNFGERLSELEKYKNKIIVVTDKVGQQASNAGKKLRQADFDVRRLQGGMSEWTGQGLPLVKK